MYEKLAGVLQVLQPHTRAAAVTKSILNVLFFMSSWEVDLLKLNL